MSDFKTVEGLDKLNPIQAKQKEDVSRMRTSLLMCGTDSNLAKTSINNITVLRVYHQLARIINYTEMMDKIEAKLYESIDSQLDRMDVNSTSTWITLLNIQEKLQKNMIESMKLIQPYLDINEYVTLETTPADEQVPTLQLDASKREKLRNSAQSVLKELNAG